MALHNSSAVKQFTQTAFLTLVILTLLLPLKPLLLLSGASHEKHTSYNIFHKRRDIKT